MKISRVYLPIISLGFALTAFAQSGTFVYVSPAGSDSNSGTQSSPKKSVYAAMDAVRAARAAGNSGQFVIQIAPGTYEFNRALTLGSTDGGASGAPLIFRGESKDVAFDGSRSVGGWQKISGLPYNQVPLSARDQVFVAPLPTSGGAMLDGIAMDTGVMNRRGFPYQTTQTWSTLIFNGSTMELAKHPNTGWLTVPQDHDGSQTSIPIADQIPYGWNDTGDIWAYGYFAWDWADSFEKVASLDSTSGRMSFGEQPYYGIRKGQRFVLVNAIEAIDAPNEYFIDRSSSLVYFYPPLNGQTDLQKVASLNAGARLTALDVNMVETNGTFDVTFENITFQNGRRSAAKVKNGARVAFKGCTFKRFNYNAVIVDNGFSHLFQSCDFKDLDEGGLVLNGGDRVSLVPSGHLVVNCKFEDYSKLCRTYRPAVSVRGVGNRVLNCRIENAPHSGIVLHGNNNVVEKSEFYRLCLQTSDSGAIYIGRNPSYQGNKVTYNRFQDIWTQQTGNYSNFTAGVYMDDMASGMDVTMNLFKNVQIGAVVGGGRDVRLDNNYFINTGKAVHFDARGTSWASDFMTRWNVPGMLAEVPYQQNPWATTYPKLVNYLSDEPSKPKRDSLTHSVNVGNTDWLLLLDNLTTSSDLAANPQIYNALNSNTILDPGFVDMANENFGFASGSNLASLGIVSIDTRLMGLYSDEFRTVGSSTIAPPPPAPAPSLDTISPTIPASPKSLSGSGVGQVTISWTASSDDSGLVSKYNVYRSSRSTGSFSIVGSSTSLVFIDAAGRGKTRFYYVVAVDPSGNKSSKSVTISGMGKR